MLLKLQYYWPLLLLLCWGCHTTKVYPKQPERNGKAIFKMARTPCFGSCPVFEATLYENGLLIYNGKRFTVKIGCFYARVSPKEQKKMAAWFNEAGFWDFKDQYPEQDIAPADLPTCTLYYFDGSRQKQVVDKRIKTPESLSMLETKLDTWITLQNLQSCDK